MYDFVSHVLRRYFEATGWSEHNSYLNLHSTSSALLDFPTPPGVSFSVSSRPVPPFFTTYHLYALPVLQGSIGYMFTRVQGQRGAALDIGQSSGNVGLEKMMERFHIPPLPAARPKQQGALEGESHVGDYLMYGSVHLPSYRVDGLYTWRLSPSMQAIVTASSAPPKVPFVTQLAHLAGLYPEYDGVYSGSLGSSSFALGSAAHWATPANVQLLLQRDTGKMCTEYSYSVDDDLWGFRLLYNFGAPGTNTSQPVAAVPELLEPITPPGNSADSPSKDSSSRTIEADGEAEVLPRDRLRVPFADEVRAIFSDDGSWTAGRGLRGRFSAGAELFFSRAQKSAGLSTGLRFSTVPEEEGRTPQDLGDTSLPYGTEETESTALSRESESDDLRNAHPTQTPTILTATLNPLLGHLSMSYAARMTPDLAACSRFDFNVYSYDSELTIGLEYWLRAAQLAAPPPATDTTPATQAAQTSTDSITNLPHPTSLSGPVADRDTFWDSKDLAIAASSSGGEMGAEPVADQVLVADESRRPTAGPGKLPNDVTGLLKLRLSSTADIALLWEGRLRNSLVSAGFRGNVNNRARPLTSVGLELMYFSSA